MATFNMDFGPKAAYERGQNPAFAGLMASRILETSSDTMPKRRASVLGSEPRGNEVTFRQAGDIVVPYVGGRVATAAGRDFANMPVPATEQGYGR